MFNFIVQEAGIIISENSETFIVPSSLKFLYTELKKVLETDPSSLNNIQKYTNYSTYLESTYPGLVIRDNSCSYNGLDLTGLKERIIEFVNNNLPLEPIMRFAAKTAELNSNLKLQVRELVSKGSYPITWDGDLIAYKRSSWDVNVAKAPEFSSVSSFKENYKNFKDTWGSVFIPGQQLVADNNSTLKVGSFDWVSSKCPDSGAFFDVSVSVKDICSINTDIILVKSYTNLSKLQENISFNSVGGPLVSVSLEANNYGQSVIVKHPINASNVAEFLKANSDLNKVINNSLNPQLQATSC